MHNKHADIKTSPSLIQLPSLIKQLVMHMCFAYSQNYATPTVG